MLFGGARRVYVAGRNELEALVLDRDSGQALGRRKIPHFNTRMLERDGRVLVWEAVNNATRLRLFDPWEQRDIWSKEFAPGAKGNVEGDIVALMAPSGQCAILKIDSGETLNLVKLEPVENLDCLLVHRSSDRIILAAAAHFRSTGGLSPSPIAGIDWIYPVFNGTLHGFDARTYKAIWTRKVEMQSLASRQPRALPLLTFALRVCDYDPKTKRRIGFHVDLLCLDKRDGRELYRGVLPDSSVAMDVLGDPEGATVELRTQAASVRLKWSKDAAPASGE